jgi:hypothetical protein
MPTKQPGTRHRVFGSFVEDCQRPSIFLRSSRKERQVGLLNVSGTEPWRVWLDHLRLEGYAREVQSRRVSWHAFKIAAEASEGPPLPAGCESVQIENVFKSSANFCLARSIAECIVPEIPEHKIPSGPGSPQAASSQDSASSGLASEIPSDEKVRVKPRGTPKTGHRWTPENRPTR